MLDPGVLPDAERIVGGCPPERQLALFSSTVPTAVQELIGKLFTDAEVIRSDGSHRVVPSLTTINRTVVAGKRLPILRTILAERVTGGTLAVVGLGLWPEPLVSDSMRAAESLLGPERSVARAGSLRPEFGEHRDDVDRQSDGVPLPMPRTERESLALRDARAHRRPHLRLSQ